MENDHFQDISENYGVGGLVEVLPELSKKFPQPTHVGNSSLNFQGVETFNSQDLSKPVPKVAVNVPYEKMITSKKRENDLKDEQLDAELNALKQQKLAMKERKAAWKEEKAAWQEEKAAWQEEKAAMKEEDVVIKKKMAAIEAKKAVIKRENAQLEEVKVNLYENHIGFNGYIGMRLKGCGIDTSNGYGRNIEDGGYVEYGDNGEDGGYVEYSDNDEDGGDEENGDNM